MHHCTKQFTSTTSHFCKSICTYSSYLFWTDWAVEEPSVSRANLDGSNIRRLFTKPVVVWPNGITIDHIAERIYWVDAQQDYIASSDLDGKRLKKVIVGDVRLSMQM